MPGKFERAMDHHYCIRAEPAVLFRARTQPAGLPRWLYDTAEISPWKGGSSRIGWRDGPTHAGTTVDVVPGKRIALSRSGPGVGLDETVCSFVTEPQEVGSPPRIVHGGFPHRGEWVDLYEGADPGWAYFERNLKVVREQRPDLPSESQGWV